MERCEKGCLPLYIMGSAFFVFDSVFGKSELKIDVFGVGLYIRYGVFFAAYQEVIMFGLGGHELSGLLVVFLIFVFYFLPAYVARWRNHPSKTGVSVLNLFLGWTFLGWIFALVWACSGDGRGKIKCPYCAEMIQKGAVVCRYCSRDVAQGG